MPAKTNRIHYVIMAGGSGTRFWPKSRTLRPKQLLDLSGSGKTLLEDTIDRIKTLCPLENINVVTGEKILSMVKKVCPKKINIIAEPVGRNTAACIGYMAARISHFYSPQDIMIVLPSDHLITETKKFTSVLQMASMAAASNKCFVTIGVKPTGPHTGYGYIQVGKNTRNELYKVRSFKEKPDTETAKRFLRSGGYLWNSGIFAVQAGVVMSEIKTHMPKLYLGIQKISNPFGAKNENSSFKKFFPLLESQSIDFGVIEKLSNTLTIKADFGWNDLGSWISLETLKDQQDFGVSNTDNIVFLDSSSNIIDENSNKKLIALLGIKDLLIIDTPDVLLVANKKYDQKIKNIVEELKRKKKEALT